MAIGLLGMLGLGALGVGGAAAWQSGREQDKLRDPSQMQTPTGRAPSQAAMVQEMLRRHNAGHLNLPDEQVRRLAHTAGNMGMKFEVESKPLQKFMFDAADTALFGLIPNEFRPSSIGEEIHGESWEDRMAGGLGTAGGALLSGGLLIKGGKMALGGLKGWLGKGTQATAAARANSNANMLGGGFTQPQLTQGGLLNAPVFTGYKYNVPFTGGRYGVGAQYANYQGMGPVTGGQAGFVYM